MSILLSLNLKKNLKKYLKSKICTAEVHEPAYEHCYDDFYLKDYEDWKDLTVDNLPNGYTIEEYMRGEVIETELA